MTAIFNDVFKESFGTTVSFRFKNFISVTGNNEEQRIAQWDQPLMSFDLSREILTQEELDALLLFHEQQNGREKTFLYKDPFDNHTDVYTSNNGIFTHGTILNLGNDRSKVCKIYSMATSQFTEGSSFRLINYPFNLKLYDLSNNLLTDWTWDSVNKEVIIVRSDWIYATFDFYIPVRFGQDEIEYNLIGYDGDTALYSIPKLSLLEVREENKYIIENLFKSNLNHTFNLDGFADSTTFFQSNSIVEETDSGFEQIENDNSRIFKITLGDRILKGDEVNYLIGLYRIARGTASTFNFIDLVSQVQYLVRFDSDFSLSLERDSSCGVFAKFNSVSLIQVVELNKSVDITGYTVGTQEKRKFDLYYGFTSSNGAEYAESRIKTAYLNGQQFIGGGNIPKTVNGYASLSSINDQVILVPNQKKVAGSCFVNTPLDNNFNINNFSVFFVCNVGKDGLAFIIHGQTTGVNAIGVMASELGNAINFLTTSQILALNTIEGKSLGYVGIAPSVAIELDCYKNEFDPNDNHIGVNINGSLSSFAYGSPNFSIQDSDDVNVWVDYVAPNLKVYANNSGSKPSVALIDTTINIGDYLGVYQESAPTVTDSIDKGIGISTLCYCWKIVRKDGVVIGVTNHDRNIPTDSMIFYANGGFSGTAIESDFEMSVDNSEVRSFFVNELVTEKDILGGKYDKAEIFIYLVDWNEYSIISTLQRGIVGQITSSNRTYTLEMRSTFELLSQKNTIKTSSNCPLIFGETGPNKCNKDLTGLITNTTINGVTNSRIFSISSAGYPDKYFNYGTVEFLSGQNEGLKADIYSFDGVTITLWQGMPYPVTINDSIKITKGCEKSLNACKDYNNTANFGGDPFVPGADTYLSGALEYSNPID